MKERMKQRLLSLLLAMAMVCSLTAGMPVTAFGADQDIVVLYTNDVHCGVDDNIGYAGLALYKKQMQQQTPYVTLVDAGDAIQGAPIGTLSEGGYLIDIMNYVGYDVAVPGNHEFDYGMSRFLELAGRLSCGYYACNFMDKATGATVFAPYKMIAYGDTKIAYVGPRRRALPSPHPRISRTVRAIISIRSVKMRADRAFTTKSRQAWTRPGMRALIM